MTIDLRSDTVTQPTEAMFEAMRRAPLGDDGREGDPTVVRLEALAAERTGKEAGLFVVSGTMGNLVALLVHTGRGGEVIAEAGSHILRSEMGGIAGLAGLFNGAVRLGVDAAEIAAHSDTITFCISKGLSAPVGSLLTGPRDFIDKARAYRRMVGGNLRQGGVIAAAGIVALGTMVERLAEDHATAHRLAEGLHRIDAALVDRAAVETNIVQVDTRGFGRPAAAIVADLRARGVLAGVWSKWVMRMVTHRHI